VGERKGGRQVSDAGRRGAGREGGKEGRPSESVEVNSYGNEEERIEKRGDGILDNIATQEGYRASQGRGEATCGFAKEMKRLIGTNKKNPKNHKSSDWKRKPGAAQWGVEKEGLKEQEGGPTVTLPPSQLQQEITGPAE